MEKVEVKIINKSDNPLPKYETEFSAGVDLRADLKGDDIQEYLLGYPEHIVIKPHQSFRVPTGLFVEIPEGFEWQIRPRSGLAFRNNITVGNSPGTIDSDYRGEVQIILINHGYKNYYINHGDRIAQAVLTPVVQAEFIEVNELSETDRGDGGFGSTGNK